MTNKIYYVKNYVHTLLHFTKYASLYSKVQDVSGCLFQGVCGYVSVYRDISLILALTSLSTSLNLPSNDDPRTTTTIG